MPRADEYFDNPPKTIDLDTDGFMGVFDYDGGSPTVEGFDGRETKRILDGTTPNKNAQTGTTYTLALSDKGLTVTLDNASQVDVTVPDNASVSFAVGDIVYLRQLGAGQVVVVPGSGVTINSLEGNTALSGQYAEAYLEYLGSDAWLLVGALTAAPST